MIKKEIYKAFDGKEFINENECVQYENSVRLNNRINSNLPLYNVAYFRWHNCRGYGTFPTFRNPGICTKDEILEYFRYISYFRTDKGFDKDKIEFKNTIDELQLYESSEIFYGSISDDDLEYEICITRIR